MIAAGSLQSSELFEDEKIFLDLIRDELQCSCDLYLIGSLRLDRLLRWPLV